MPDNERGTMRRYLAAAAASAALVAGIGITTAGSAAADSVGWCNGSTRVSVGSQFIVQPYHRGTGRVDCTLARGASGSAVSALQRALRQCNYAGGLRVDGDFGPRTEEALKYAQFRRGVVSDGIYGPNTRVALRWPSYYRSGTATGDCVRSPSGVRP
ncbi:putative peptidoglycan binding protein [Prauserella shujinwangii]|uniref:Putative peptidoglycan binding protein n=1 Tax=Prauserella shujinwangii TaxID=1453103 RepID=A0A2T0LLF2_9PSEU|nr:peptidoglycan-binding domain-containing protein [Prauserella shujinwangii]PRX43861.1 putative peptidoglycan binding protein [Prauserella shujinwangii]